MTETILEIDNLTSGYQVKQGRVEAVKEVSFNLGSGEFLGVAGESGCGKSTLAYSILGLLEDNGRIFSGSINFKGQDLAALSQKEMKKIRWSKISMVFQSAMNALNPVITIKEQLLDAMFAHRPGLKEKEAVARAEELLELVNITPDRLYDYPHQLSGGMKQRIMIAMAMVLQPDIIIMDEPTTALDVVVQRNIIEKIDDLQERFNFSIIFITHDLSLLVEISDRLAIMYAGRLVELGNSTEIYKNPAHPYTEGLMASFPPLVGEIKEVGGIPGKPPDFFKLPEGCKFEPRCPYAFDRCKKENPEFKSYDKTGRLARCFLAGEER